MASEGPPPAATRIHSFAHALRGLGWMLLSQPNARIHAVLTLAVVGAAAAVGVTRLEWIALLLAIGGVWSAEAFNSALEALADAVSPGFHPLVGRAKDAAAGGVLLAALAAACVGGAVFAPHLLRWLRAGAPALAAAFG